MPTNLDKTTLQALWINGFIPQGTDYANLINSQVNVAETSAQSMQGALVTPELITPHVSATGGTIKNTAITNSTINNVSLGLITPAQAVFTTVTAAAIYSDQITVQNLLNDQTIIGNNVFIGSNSNTRISAGNNAQLSGSAVLVSSGNNMNLNATGNISLNASNSSSVLVSASINVSMVAASNINLTAAGNVAVTGTLTRDKAIISAAGTTQATGALVSASVNVCKGVVDGQTTGFRLLANKTGLTQYLYSDSVSANLWPPTGGQINALGANTVFPMAVNTLYTVVHTGASAYAVK